MIARRFSGAVAVLLGVALVPTVIHTYVGLAVDDGRVASAVGMHLAGLTASATGRKGGWAIRKFESDDWVERWYTGDGERIQLLVVRSYDLKRLYHHPELAIVQTDDLMPRGVVQLSGPGSPPIHVFQSRDANRRGLALYALHHDGEFVDDAIRFQIRTAASLLFSGRRPMTLFFVYDEDAGTAAPLEELDATRLLLEAVDSFLKQPVTTER